MFDRLNGHFAEALVELFFADQIDDDNLYEVAEKRILAVLNAANIAATPAFTEQLLEKARRAGLNIDDFTENADIEKEWLMVDPNEVNETCEATSLYEPFDFPEPQPCMCNLSIPHIGSRQSFDMTGFTINTAGETHIIPGTEVVDWTGPNIIADCECCPPIPVWGKSGSGVWEIVNMLSNDGPSIASVLDVTCFVFNPDETTNDWPTSLVDSVVVGPYGQAETDFFWLNRFMPEGAQ
jgi:hypothetical protein